MKMNEHIRGMELVEEFIMSERFTLYCGLNPHWFIKALRKRGGERHNRHVASRKGM